MTRTTLCGSLLLPLVLALSSHSARAAESYDNCTGYIDTVPAVISAQGNWCLRKDLASGMASGDLISITANNVTLDCNNFKLGGLAAGDSTSTYGIRAISRSNVTVRNCIVRGFYRGIALSGGGHLIEDNNIEASTNMGILATGEGTVVRRNRVLDTGGTTSPLMPVDFFVQAEGIYSFGNVDIIDNLVSGVAVAEGRTSFVDGISSVNNSGGTIANNRIRGLVPGGANFADAIVLTGELTGRVIVSDNHIVATDGMNNGAGVICFQVPANKVTVIDNVVSGFATVTGGCLVNADNQLTP